MSNLVPFRIGPIADYYLILPSFGLAVIVASLILRSANAVIERPPGSAFRTVFLILFAMLIAWRATFAIRSFRWAQKWTSPMALLYQSTTTRFTSYRACADLARRLLLSNELEEARKLAAQAVREAPWYALSYDVLGDAHVAQDRCEDAQGYYEQSIQKNPDRPYPHYALASTQNRFLKDTEAAEQNYRKVIAFGKSPYLAQAALELAHMLQQEGNHAAAVPVLQQALALDPESRDLRAALQLSSAR